MKAAEILGAQAPPNSNEAEMAVLGALILNKSAFDKTVTLITEEAFYQPKHQIIWRAIKQLQIAEKPVDLLTLREKLISMGKLEKIGGDAYVAQLNRAAPSAANIEHHALIILEKYLKRLLIDVGLEMAKNAQSNTNDIYEELETSEQKLFEISQKRFSKDFTDMKSVANKTLDYLMELSKKENAGITGVGSGLERLDEMLGGFQDSDLIIIAARPSMGKTALAMSIQYNLAKSKIPHALFSIEMDQKQIAKRLASQAGRIDMGKVSTGRLSPSEKKAFVRGLSELSEAPIWIDDSAYLTIMELKAKARRLKSQHEIKMIIVDYLQLLHSPGAESREREVAQISSGLKALAKDLEIPVIALAQLNRSVESRGKEALPMLSDLRESGSIEQDADVIMFIHRPERAGASAMPDGTPAEGKAVISIAKHRNGATGLIITAFRKQFARFENLILETEDQPETIKKQF